MAYIPTEWETGDVITAAKLNNMEQGIEDAFVAPAVTIADEGDVLTVNSSGEWAAATPASPLPAVTIADEGDVLTVNSSGEWAAAAPASPLPEVAAADQGKVLTVDSSGDWVAANIEGLLPTVTAADAGKITRVAPAGIWELAYNDVMQILATIPMDIATMTPTGITVQDVDFSVIPNYKTAIIKASLTASGLGDIGTIYVPLAGALTGIYNFACVCELNTAAVFVSIVYNETTENWSVSMAQVQVVAN